MWITSAKDRHTLDQNLIKSIDLNALIDFCDGIGACHFSSKKWHAPVRFSREASKAQVLQAEHHSMWDQVCVDQRGE